MIQACGKLFSAVLVGIVIIATSPVAFAKSPPLQKGSASWYRNRGCLCAASPDYPKGTKLRVTVVGSNKSMVVRVNDYGPNRRRFPTRAIDLDAVAFRQLAPLSRGLIQVLVVPIPS